MIEQPSELLQIISSIVNVAVGEVKQMKLWFAQQVVNAFAVNQEVWHAIAGFHSKSAFRFRQ